MKLPVIAIAIFAFALDWYSTIIQSPAAEENPVMRIIWEVTGNVGFTVATLLFLALVIALIHLIFRHVKNPALFAVALGAVFVLFTFKTIIGLTNLGLVPYSWTSWFQFS